MPVRRMHDDEVTVDEALVRRLLAAQCPDRADLTLRRVESHGTDNVIFRLGHHLAVRLPKIGWAAGQPDKERRWLPLIGPRLPVDVPAPVHVGEPGEGYPFRWSVSPWLEGERPTQDVDLERLARDLAAFVLALQRIDTTGAPSPRPGRRGGPLDAADGFTRERADELRGETDVDALLAIWDAGREAPPWTDEPVWVHGDLSDGNLVVREGRLAGVIDWSGMVAGDPAVELMVAWSHFDGPSRTAYLEALGFVDDATWLRGRAWAVAAALQALPYYRRTNPDIVARSWRTVAAVLADR